MAHTHITDASAKASRMLGFVRANNRGCPKELKQLSYFSLIHSKLEYTCSVWDPCLVKDKEFLTGEEQDLSVMTVREIAASQKC